MMSTRNADGGGAARTDREGDTLTRFSSFALSGKIVIKAQLRDDIRVIPIGNDCLTYDELVLMMQRIYKETVQPKEFENITIKYKDGDGDLITLLDSNDVSLALTQSPVLRIFLLPNKQTKEVNAIRSELVSIRDKIDSLLLQVDALPSVEKLVNGTDKGARAVLSPDRSSDEGKRSRGGAFAASPPSEGLFRPVHPADLDPLEGVRKSAPAPLKMEPVKQAPPSFHDGGGGVTAPPPLSKAEEEQLTPVSLAAEFRRHLVRHPPRSFSRSPSKGRRRETPSSPSPRPPHEEMRDYHRDIFYSDPEVPPQGGLAPPPVTSNVNTASLNDVAAPAPSLQQSGFGGRPPPPAGPPQAPYSPAPPPTLSPYPPGGGGSPHPTYGGPQMQKGPFGPPPPPAAATNHQGPMLSMSGPMPGYPSPSPPVHESTASSLPPQQHPGYPPQQAPQYTMAGGQPPQPHPFAPPQQQPTPAAPPSFMPAGGQFVPTQPPANFSIPTSAPSPAPSSAARMPFGGVKRSYPTWSPGDPSQQQQQQQAFLGGAPGGATPPPQAGGGPPPPPPSGGGPMGGPPVGGYRMAPGQRGSVPFNLGQAGPPQQPGGLFYPPAPPASVMFQPAEHVQPR